MNARGWIAGFSENGAIDPLTLFPESRAVLWTDDQMIDLGTLGGYESAGLSVNNRGQVTGFATNESYCLRYNKLHLYVSHSNPFRKS
jgi:probable HAF family extracellular repeat protein